MSRGYTTPPSITNGQRFGRWVAQRAQRPNEFGRHTLPCRCDCGTRKRVRISNLLCGSTLSCGCRTSDRMRTHGLSKTPTYDSWEHMIARCYNKRNRFYKNYGGRGIGVCKRFRSFASFFAVMGERPTGLTIDRIANDGGYDCGKCADCRSRGVKKLNCRWATRLEQNGNTRKNMRLTFCGETHHQAEWSRITVIGSKTIEGRLKRGWSVERALSVQPDARFRWRQP